MTHQLTKVQRKYPRTFELSHFNKGPLSWLSDKTMGRNGMGDDPQTFWDNVLWTDESKVKLCGRQGPCYIWCNQRIPQKGCISMLYGQAWRWKCNAVVMLSCFRARMTCYNWGKHEFQSIPENPEGERTVLSLWVEAHVQLDYAARHRFQESLPENGSKGIQCGLVKIWTWTSPYDQGINTFSH